MALTLRKIEDPIEEDMDEDRPISSLANSKTFPKALFAEKSAKKQSIEQTVSPNKNGKKEKEEKVATTPTAPAKKAPTPKVPTPTVNSNDINQFAKFAFGNSQSDSEKQFEEDPKNPFHDKGSERATLRTPGAGKPAGRNEARMEWLDDIRDANGK